ncbi:hypothetical protein GJA_1203 [Janthinobacterium agaricidamnosum NBRC 102515 = DSM 9628]|uniref:Uncharacterized protein n=1 Tax=Janthinobacterium agaricidamnosum NBRC 102515 = DSM 9628 TaxID=1349767 RepID=W0V1W1_9BURK|nr:hypothetical protein GJA_1203 [Janthinobacterium agaricidamnosum NBRC 102515 = DSM 9628]
MLLLLHQQQPGPQQKQLYIQNEGLREIFWEDRVNEDAK